MEIIQILKRTVSKQPDLLVVVGECSVSEDHVIVYPRPGQTSVSFVFRREDIAEGPLDFESDTEPYSRPEVKAVKVRKGSTMVRRMNGAESQVKLVADETRGSNLFSLGSSERQKTYCIGLLEFECGSDKLLGPCIFGWDCD